MARGRMISATLGESRKYAALQTDTARVLYPLIVANTDKGGRLEADGIYVTRKVCTRLPYDQASVEQALNDMADVGLIILYERRGVPYLQVVNFLEHNTPHHKEADSEIPPPDGYNVSGKRLTDDDSQASSKHEPSKAQASPMQADNRSKEKEREGKEREGGSANADRPTPEEAFETQAKTGTDPRKTEHRFRDRLRFRAGAEFTREHAEDVPRWSREHPIDRIDEFWEASKPSLWSGTPKSDKRRVWIFADLLNQDVLPPGEGSEALADYVEAGL